MRAAFHLSFFEGDDIRAVIARPLEQAQTDRIDGHDEESAGPMRDFGKLLGRIIHEMRESLDGDGGVIYLYDDKANIR